MQLPRQIEYLIFSIVDAVLPHAPEAVIARSLSEETLVKLLHPITYHQDAWIRALFSYFNPKVRALIWAVKYRNEQGPLPALGRVAAREINRIMKEDRAFGGWERPLVVAIPSSPERVHARGYSQAERIALAIVPNLGAEFEYAPDILGRKDRESQARLPRERRHHNVEGAFFVLRPEKVRGRDVLIIDDVVESGATLKEARKVLRASGARSVAAVALAH